MSATSEMPYFIKPSQNLSPKEKQQAYQKASNEIEAILLGEQDNILKMVTINCLLKTHLPYYYWVGFYLVNNGKLTVGPYQGTLGCLHIEFGKGVCGKAAKERKTQLIKNVHTLKGSAHIACDPNSSSEIVVPVFDKNNHLIAVFDVDSTITDSFDETDKVYLEDILTKQFGELDIS